MTSSFVIINGMILPFAHAGTSRQVQPPPLPDAFILTRYWGNPFDHIEDHDIFSEYHEMYRIERRCKFCVDPDIEDILRNKS
jgi:hypothetical protein